MLMRASVDFFYVEPKHDAIHARLENWAKSCTGWSKPKVAAGFSMASSSNARGEEVAAIATPVDRIDAMQVGKAVIALPDRHRRAIQWSYVQRTNPRRAAQSLAVSLQGLADLVRDGRQMLINRNA